MTFDPEAVRAFEHAGWQQAASHYTATFAHATAGFIGDLLDVARVGAGMHVLDLACGPGLAAAAAAERGALPVGLDFSSAMIALARTRHPGLLFEEGDAEALPFADASFDAVVANFGIHHVSDPVQALCEARRVLAPGGLVAFTSWAAPAENVAWQLVFDAIAEHGDMSAATAPPPGGSLRQGEDLVRVLDAAGFTETRARRVRREWHFAAAGDLLEGFRRGTVRTAALIGAQPRSALPAIQAAIAHSTAAYRSGRRLCRSDRRGPGLGSSAVTIAGTGATRHARVDSPGATGWPANARAMSSRAFRDRR